MNVSKSFVLLLFVLPATAPAQTTQPQVPLLQQINAETQDLYRSVRQGFVRVELPPPRWMQAFNQTGDLQPNDPAQKYRLNAEVRQMIEAQARAFGESGGGLHVYIPANMPTNIPANIPATQPTPGVTGAERSAERQPRSGNRPFDSTATAAGPKVIGLILDQEGHVLLPIFIDKEAIADRPLMAIDARGERVNGSFIGSDRLTGLTVLKMDRPVGRPLPLAGGRPAEGSLVMLLEPSGEGGRLCVWTGGSQDWGIAIGIDGTMHGFVRSGQFLCAGAMRPLAEQLVRDGVVHRATLGVEITQVQAPIGVTGAQQVLHIDWVASQSAAAAAGLRPGDLICSFAGTPVTDLANFSAAIAVTNGRADLMILRDAHPMNISVELKPQ